jgi:hypothetical protein
MKLVIASLAILSSVQYALAQSGNNYGSQDYVYQLAVYALNEPEGAVDKIEADTDKILQLFLKDFPSTGYEIILAGQAITTSAGGGGGRRSLRLGTKERELQTSAPTESAQGVAYCPKTCATSTSQKCKSLGCARCGSSCRRRLRELKNDGTKPTTDTKKTGGRSQEANKWLGYKNKDVVDSTIDLTSNSKIEATLDEYLTKEYCGSTKQCVIKSKIFVVDSELGLLPIAF